MSERSTVIFLADDTDKTGYDKPMMLQGIMGLPMLSWLAAELVTGGCERFFLAVNERFRAEATACFPEDVTVTAASGMEIFDQLHVFLSTAEDTEDEVLFITSPVLVLPKGAAPLPASAPGAFAASRGALMEVLDDSASLSDFLREQGRRKTAEDRFYAVSSPEELPRWQPIFSRRVLERLAHSGVEIWDYGNCYVEPTVFVGSGSVLMPGTILRGHTIIGRDCVIGPNSLLVDTKVDDRTTVNASQLYNAIVGYDTTVGPFAYIRPGSVIGNSCRVGDFVEVKNSGIGDGTKISHLTYVGDSDVGQNCNFGCGTVTVNYDRAHKHRTTIGDNCFIGCNSNLVAPVTLGDGAYTAAGSTITEDVPGDALAIARARQVNKKDWAKDHYVKEKK